MWLLSSLLRFLRRQKRKIIKKDYETAEPLKISQEKILKDMEAKNPKFDLRTGSYWRQNPDKFLQEFFDANKKYTTDDIRVPEKFKEWIIGQDDIIRRIDLMLVEWIYTLKLLQDMEKQEASGIKYSHVLRERPTTNILMIGSPGTGKCYAKGTNILLYDGTIKKVEDIKEGDFLMGPDSKPRRVLSITKGTDMMYKITPVKGEPFIVNGNHILVLIGNGHYEGQIREVTVDEWLRWPKTWKHNFKLFRVGVEFPNKQPLPLDPYTLGVILGDGGITTGTPSITTSSIEIINSVRKVVESLGLKLSPSSLKDKAQTYYISGKIEHKIHKNIITEILKSLGLYGLNSEEKFIPQIYKVANRQARLELLAGLIDTDGSLSCNGFDYITKSRSLAEDVAFVVRSLGFATYIKPCIKTDQNGTAGVYYRLFISGNVAVIPTRVPYKKANPRKQIKDVLRTGFSIEEVGIDNYYGFMLDGDGRHLLGDFTVSHNSLIVKIMAEELKDIYKQENIELEDVILTEDVVNRYKANVRYLKPNGIGKKLVSYAEMKETQIQNRKHGLIMSALVGVILAGFSLLAWGLRETILYIMAGADLTTALSVIGPIYFTLGISMISMPLFILIFLKFGFIGTSFLSTSVDRLKTPNLIVDNDPKDAEYYENATIISDSLLFGEIEWDALQTPGLGIPPYKRAKAGLVHKANKKILYIDEIRNLTPSMAIKLLSLSKDRYVVIKERTKVKILSLEELFNRYSTEVELRDGYEIIDVSSLGLQTLGYRDKGQWVKLNKIIRHRYKGKMVKLSQKWGQTEATPKHSVYAIDGTLVDAESNPELLAIRNSISMEETIDIEDFPITPTDTERIITQDSKGHITRILVNGNYHRTKLVQKWGEKEILALLRIIASYISEGCTSIYEAKDGKVYYRVQISQKNDKKLLSDVADAVKTISNLTPIILPPHKDGVSTLVIQSKALTLYLKEKCGMGATNKKIPDFIYSLPTRYKHFFLKELIRGDGYYKPKRATLPTFEYTTASSRLVAGLSLLLSILGINYSISYSKPYLSKGEQHTVYHILERSKGIEQFSSQIANQFGHYGKQLIKREANLYRKARQLKIESREIDDYVYDLECEETHNFVDAFGLVVVHNTVMEDGETPIRAQGSVTTLGGSSTAGQNLETPPIKSMFFLLVAGNNDIIEDKNSIINQMPALRDRFENYGDIIYLRDEVEASPENLMRMCQAVTDELYRYGFPPMEAQGVKALIDFVRDKATDKNHIKLMFRIIIKIIKKSTQLCWNEDDSIIREKHVLTAIEQFFESIEHQMLTKELDKERPIKVVETIGEKIGALNGLAVVGHDRYHEGAGDVFAVEAWLRFVDDEKYADYVISGAAKNGEDIHDSIKDVRTAIYVLYGIDISKHCYTHIKFSQTRVDGPSAGITMTLAIMSILGEPWKFKKAISKVKKLTELDLSKLSVPLRQDIAVTGALEILIENDKDIQISAVGGINEKIDVAERYGLKCVIIPQTNFDLKQKIAYKNVKILSAKTVLEYFSMIRGGDNEIC
jgi:predicted ATP-dependent protease